MNIALRTTRQCNLKTYSSCWRLSSDMSMGYAQSYCWNNWDGFGRIISCYDEGIFSDFSRSWNLNRQEAEDLIRRRN